MSEEDRFQTWAQSIDQKVWAKNDIHYAKLAWDESRKELEAELTFHKNKHASDFRGHGSA
jgi:hypothetical protein